MRSFYLLLVTLIIGISSTAQKDSTDDAELYDYDTTLSGGYSISFKVDDSLQYLYLMKGDKKITELASTSKGMLYKNLGYIGADFTNYFVLVHSFGGGNPHSIELIKKSTGENILDDGAALIDAEKKKEFLLYCNKDVPDKQDKMILLNVRTGQKKSFNFPNDIFDGPQVLNRIQISKLTDKQLVIRFDTEKGSKMKIYNR